VVELPILDTLERGGLFTSENMGGGMSCALVEKGRGALKNVVGYVMYGDCEADDNGCGLSRMTTNVEREIQTRFKTNQTDHTT